MEYMVKMNSLKLHKSMEINIPNAVLSNNTVFNQKAWCERMLGWSAVAIKFKKDVVKRYKLPVIKQMSLWGVM